MQEQGSNNVIVTSAYRDVLRHNSQDNTSKNILFSTTRFSCLISGNISLRNSKFFQSFKTFKSSSGMQVILRSVRATRTVYQFSLLRCLFFLLTDEFNVSMVTATFVVKSLPRIMGSVVQYSEFRY